MLLSTGLILTEDDLDSLGSANDCELWELLTSLPEVDREAILEVLIERAKPPEQPETETGPIGLYEFGKMAWAVLRPGEQFIDGAHIRTICAHLEHATNTPGYDLVIMLPPGMGKSIWTAVIWPAWTWGPRGWSAARFLFATYSKERGEDDARKFKGLVESDWYQKLWPEVELASEAITALMTTSGGSRKTAGVGGLGTGEHPHFVVADDANKQTDSAAEFRGSVSWWTGQMSTRGIVASVDSRHVVIGQRLIMDDVPGACINLGYDVVCMPMWAWDPPSETELSRGDWRPKPTALGWVDDRQPGEILWPDGITETKARKVEMILGPIQAAAQFQQRPIRVAIGGLFPRSSVASKMIDFANIPWKEIDKVIRFWDKAGGVTEGADRTAGVCIGRWVKRSAATGIAPEIRYIVLNVIVGRWNPFERNLNIRSTAEADVKLYGRKVELWIEKEARGGSGIESAQISARELLEFGVRFDEPKTSKLLRARPFSAAWHAGLVYLVVGTWNQAYLDEMEAFTGEDQTGIHDDMVDGSSGAGARLINSPLSSGALPGGSKSKV